MDTSRNSDRGLKQAKIAVLLPHRLECRRCLVMRILSVSLSNVGIVTKWKKDLSRFLYHTNDHLA